MASKDTTTQPAPGAPPPSYNTAAGGANPAVYNPPSVIQPAQPVYAGYPPPGYGQPAYGQPAYGQPAYGQPAYGQPANTGSTTVVLTQPAVRPLGSCAYCGGFLRERFTACGIILAILCFPWGLICCFMMMERRCSNCGR